MPPQELNSVLICTTKNCPFTENPYLVLLKKQPNESISPLPTRNCPNGMYP